MSQQTQNEIFKLIANKLVGRWHYQFKSGSLTFSLCEQEKDIAEVKVVTNQGCFRAYYTLYIRPGDYAMICFEGLADPTAATIKILTSDTLIIHHTNGKLDLLLRKADIEFADDMIERL